MSREYCPQTGKVVYASAAEAWKAIKAMVKRGKPQEPYKCPFCHEYHTRGLKEKKGYR